MATTEMSTVILPRTPQGEFRNEPFTDFSKHENAHAMREALTRVGGMLGHEYELVIGGERVRTKDKIRSINPARPSQVVGIHQDATAEHAQQALIAALKAFETWQFVSTELRASLLLRAAALIRDRKFDFCAWLVYEVGKNWVEADADVAETIHFREFLAPRSFPPRQRRPADPVSRGTRSAPLCSVGRGRRHSAVEFPFRDY